MHRALALGFWLSLPYPLFKLLELIFSLDQHNLTYLPITQDSTYNLRIAELLCSLLSHCTTPKLEQPALGI